MHDLILEYQKNFRGSLTIVYRKSHCHRLHILSSPSHSFFKIYMLEGLLLILGYNLINWHFDGWQLREHWDLTWDIVDI